MPHARPIAGLWELRMGPGRFFYFAHTDRRFISAPAVAGKVPQRAAFDAGALPEGDGLR